MIRLISSNIYVNTWIFKIDDELNGRGHASIDVQEIKAVMELRRRQVEMTQPIRDKLKLVIERAVAKKVFIAHPCLYRSWKEYLERFCKIGGVIEAAPYCSPAKISMPSIAFLIEPSGNIKLIGSFDRIEATRYVNAGCFFP